MTPAMDRFETITRSPEETQQLGRRIGELAAAGDVYLLSGELGTGKTCLTQGIAWASVSITASPNASRRVSSHPPFRSDGAY